MRSMTLTKGRRRGAMVMVRAKGDGGGKVARIVIDGGRGPVKASRDADEGPHALRWSARGGMADTLTDSGGFVEDIYRFSQSVRSWRTT